MFMFLNYKKINLRTISKIFCFSITLFIIFFSTAQETLAQGGHCKLTSQEGGVWVFIGGSERNCSTSAECSTRCSQALAANPGQTQESCTCDLSSPAEVGGSTDGDATTPAGDKYGLEEAGSGLSKTPLSGRVSTMIGALVGFVGVIFLVLMIYGGLTWMTAGGNEEKVGKAKKVIVNSTIGLIIVMLSYAITYYIIQTVTGV
jgi:hypothetical protein